MTNCGKKFFVLIDAAKPIVVSDSLDSRNALNLVAIGGKRLNDRYAIDRDEAIRSCNISATIESSSNYSKERKEKERNGEGADGENQSKFLAKEVSEN